MFNVEKTKFVDCLKEESLVFLHAQLCSVDLEPFVPQEIMLRNVPAHLDCLLVTLMDLDVNKSTAWKMMIVLMINIVIGSHTLA